MEVPSRSNSYFPTSWAYFASYLHRIISTWSLCEFPGIHCHWLDRSVRKCLDFYLHKLIAFDFCSSCAVRDGCLHLHPKLEKEHNRPKDDSCSCSWNLKKFHDTSVKNLSEKKGWDFLFLLHLTSPPAFFTAGNRVEEVCKAHWCVGLNTRNCSHVWCWYGLNDLCTCSTSVVVPICIHLPITLPLQPSLQPWTGDLSYPGWKQSKCREGFLMMIGQSVFTS